MFPDLRRRFHNAIATTRRASPCDQGHDSPEGAFGDSGEDARHGVDPVFGVHVREVDDIGAIGHEGAIQEEVGEVDVAHDDHQAQRLAQEEPAGVKRKV